MLSFLASLILIASAQADPSAIVANCLCEVRNSQGEVIPASPYQPDIMLLERQDYFMVYGEKTISSDKCASDDDGSLNMYCLGDAVFAKTRAQGQCSDFARQHNPENMRASGLGQIIEESCSFSVE